MSLVVETYNRKSFPVQAVQVTRANIVAVTEWCNGELMHPEGQSQYILVNVFRPMKERQKMAYVGDWVLYAGSGFKVYTNKAFVECFEKPTGESRDALTQAEKIQPGDINFNPDVNPTHGVPVDARIVVDGVEETDEAALDHARAINYEG